MGSRCSPWRVARSVCAWCSKSGAGRNVYVLIFVTRDIVLQASAKPQLALQNPLVDLRDYHGVMYSTHAAHTMKSAVKSAVSAFKRCDLCLHSRCQISSGSRNCRARKQIIEGTRYPTMFPHIKYGKIFKLTPGPTTSCYPCPPGVGRCVQFIACRCCVCGECHMVGRGGAMGPSLSLHA